MKTSIFKPLYFLKMTSILKFLYISVNFTLSRISRISGPSQERREKKVSRDFEATMLSLLNSHLHIPSAELFVSTSQYVVYGKRISHLEKHKKKQTATQKQMSIWRVGGVAWRGLASPSSQSIRRAKDLCINGQNTP